MLGEELRKARKRKGLTQLRLAQEADVDITYVSYLEHDKKSPTLDVLFRICKALDVAPHTLIARVERAMRREGLADLGIARARARSRRQGE